MAHYSVAAEIRVEQYFTLNMSFPEWAEPMAATLTQERFTGPEWVFERKFDGIRLLAFRQGTHVRLLSRNRLEQHHPRIAEAVANLPVREVILDGEITPLFPAMRHGKLTGREPLPPANVHMMIQRRTNRRRHSDKDLLSQLPRYRHHDLLPKRRQAGVAQQMAGDEAGSQVSRAQIAAGIAHL